MMKYFLFVLVIAVVAFADNDDCTDISSGAGSYPSDGDDISTTVINEWEIFVCALGMDFFDLGTRSYFYVIDNNTNLLVLFNGGAGCIPLDSYNLDAANGSGFGVAWNFDGSEDTFYTDDSENASLFFTDDNGSTWSTASNPAGIQGRGMDFDGTDYWTTNGNGGGVWRFLPGVGQQNIATPELPTTPSGLTVFPYQSNLGIAVTCYQTFSIYFYVWDSSTMTFLGSAPCPVSGLTKSYGLAYTGTTETFFWTYQDGSGNYHLAEFSMSTNALEHSSWGAIKGSF
ncbi:hypothetical protein DRQ25_17965 [Candidatus Fermentibacteria bacterium]|nr:MAG: hypothetical protein DRQ25_17965 [Candidatus Fermentibacteria bacterium]